MHFCFMLKQFFFLTLITISLFASAQAEHESFKQDQELLNAVVQRDLKQFISEPVTFTCDTLEKQVSALELTGLIKQYFPVVKNTIIKKASETNNGFVQSFGMYKGEDALYYIRCTLNPLTGKLEEVVVEKNN